MQGSFKPGFERLRHAVRRGIYGPQALAFMPAIVLAAYWTGGEVFLVFAALGMPLLFLFAGGSFASQDSDTPERSGLVSPADAADLAQRALDRSRATQLSTGCILVNLDGLDQIEISAGDGTVEAMRDLALTRLQNTLRPDDQTYRMGEDRFVVLLGPSLKLDLEGMLQLASRLQAAVEEPATVHESMRYVSACVGFCGSDRLANDASGQALLDAAQVALSDAIANGPSAVRAWTDAMRIAQANKSSLRAEVERALEDGQIQPWFQPQLCTSTGKVSGCEALARWIHPQRGIVPPAQFLNVLADAGMMDRLGEVILRQALTALRNWDAADLDVPRVSVNFSDAELREPRLVERIKWELDRFELEPKRLGIEVLETVIAGSPDGIVARNIVDLGKLGCHIDLDDFGTGHASITALRRFKVHRLKVDRSFVTRIDSDEDQHRMLAAILGMADRLGLQTLAEGVESTGEHALLSQLGCDHVQGFGIARPMPADQLVTWTQLHEARIAEPPQLGMGSG